MIVSKTTMRLVKKNLKKMIQENEDNMERARKYLIRFALASTSLSETTKKLALAILEKELGLYFPNGVTINELELGVLKTEMDVKAINDIIRILLENLTEEGFKGVTYSLPFYILSNFGYDLGYSYLLVSGIKKNAQCKTLEDSLMDEFEISLLESEMRLSKYIEDDLSINTNYITEFISDLISYIHLYYDGKKWLLDQKDFDFQDTIDSIVINMGIYIIYAKTGHELVTKERKFFCSIYVACLRANFTEGGAIRFACQKLIGLIKDKQEEAILAQERKSTVAVPEEKYCEAFEYIQDGVVTKVCDLDRFKAMLDDSNLSDDKKREYISQMVNLKNSLAQKEFERCMKEQRERLLSPRELHLYTLAWTSEETSKDAKYIDDVIEMMLDASSEDELALLMEELFEPFAHLSEVFEAEKIGDVPKVMFLTEAVPCEEGYVESPKILNSIVKVMKGELKQIALPLKKLFDGSTHGDREFKCDNLPCRICYKGKDYKVFYTVINEVVVILDVFKGSDSFARMKNLVSKADFTNRIASIRKFLAEGNVPNEKIYIDMIERELEGTKVFVKK